MASFLSPVHRSPVRMCWSWPPTCPGPSAPPPPASSEVGALEAAGPNPGLGPLLSCTGTVPSRPLSLAVFSRSFPRLLRCTLLSVGHHHVAHASAHTHTHTPLTSVRLIFTAPSPPAWAADRLGRPPLAPHRALATPDGPCPLSVPAPSETVAIGLSS